MWYFLIGLFLLVAGYFVYGRFVEYLINPTDKEVPAQRLADGVDFMVLPHWKNMLIQLLNIAGIGPVIGLILGIRFGSIVFIILPLGNILGGAVHDYFSGIMSVRNDGANLPKLLQIYLGKHIYILFTIFLSFVLLLVVAVFINIPVNLLISPHIFNAPDYFLWAVGAVFGYYILATLLPIDKLIGKLYPLFGALLIFASIGIFGAICLELYKDSSILTPNATFPLNNSPIIPVLFVTIACGIISGFHATQSSIIARTMSSERQGRQAFYGMMVVEGVIGMIWGAAGMVIYNLKPELVKQGGVAVLGEITNHFLGGAFSFIAIISVIILAVTSGDTAMRSLRLSLAEILKVSQTRIVNRLLLCAPIILAVLGFLIWSNKDKESFDFLWNYFAWSNQVLATLTLFGATVFLYKLHPKKIFVTLVPACFMMFVITSFILWKPLPNATGLTLPTAYVIASVDTLLAAIFVYYRCRVYANASTTILENSEIEK